MFVATDCQAREKFACLKKSTRDEIVAELEEVTSLPWSRLGVTYCSMMFHMWDKIVLAFIPMKGTLQLTESKSLISEAELYHLSICGPFIRQVFNLPMLHNYFVFQWGSIMETNMFARKMLQAANSKPWQ